MTTQGSRFSHYRVMVNYPGVFRESEGTKVFETDLLAAALTDADKVKMDVQKGSGTKCTYGPLCSENSTISVSASKPLSSSVILYA